MAKPFKNLIDRMPKERRERIEEEAEAILLEMALQEWRQTHDLTSQQSANVLNVHQPAETIVGANTQKQTDIRVSTLHRILSAMGAKLKITAQFPDGEVVLNLFDYAETRAG